jgi:hypothetical protein
MMSEGLTAVLVALDHHKHNIAVTKYALGFLWNATLDTEDRVVVHVCPMTTKLNTARPVQA